MSKAVKSTFFALLLIASGYFFGAAAETISRHLELFLSFSAEAVAPIVRLLAALGALVLTAALAAALLRPTWVCVIAFILSSLALWVALGLSLINGVLVLVYLAAACLYAGSVIKGLDQRIRFSVQPVSQNQIILVIALMLIVGACFYFLYTTKIDREGFAVPSTAMDKIAEMFEAQIEARAPEMKPAEREEFLSEFREQAQTQVEKFVEPYERYVPLAVALGFVSPLWVAYTLLSWLPGLILQFIFPLLRVLRVTRVVTETREVSRLTLD